MSSATPEAVLPAQARESATEVRMRWPVWPSVPAVMHAELQQRFWEAQMAFLVVAPTGSHLLDMLTAAEQRAALLRLLRAGRSVLALSPG